MVDKTIHTSINRFPNIREKMVVVVRNTLSRYLECRLIILINLHIPMANRKLFSSCWLKLRKLMTRWWRTK